MSKPNEQDLRDASAILFAAERLLACIVKAREAGDMLPLPIISAAAQLRSAIKTAGKPSGKGE